MTDIVQLAAEVRERAGKGGARQSRRLGRVPAVIYGDKKTPLMVSLEKFAFTKILNKPGFFTHLFDVEVAGTKHRVLPRDVQFDPVSDQPLHVDFLRVSAKTKIRVDVPVVFSGQDKSPGLKRGGVLNVVHHTLELLCLADKIPEKIEVSLEGFEIGDALHLTAIKLPAGVECASHEKDFTVATVAAPSTSRADDAAAAATAAAATTAAPAAAGAKAAAPAAGAKAAAPAAKAAAPAAKAPAKKG